MTRTIWMGTIIGVTALSWLAPGQSADSPPAPAAAPTERIITVQEANRPAQKCRMIKTWKMPNGNQAMQVQALDTGEHLTIVEEGPPSAPVTSGSGSRVRTMTTRIFHWGANKTPPPGVPVPPPADVAQKPGAPAKSSSPIQQVSSTSPAVQPSSSAASKASPPKAAASDPRAANTAGPPAASRPATPAAQPPSSPPAYTGSVQTVPGRTNPTAPLPQAPGSRPAPATTPMPPTAQPAPNVSGPGSAPVPVMVIEEAPKSERGWLGRLFNRGKSTTTPIIKTVPAMPVRPAPGPTSSANPSGAPVEMPAPTDYRQSWGKPTAPAGSGAKGKPEQTPTSTPASTPAGGGTSRAQPGSLPDLPRASGQQADPLKEPGRYSRNPFQKGSSPAKPAEAVTPVDYREQTTPAPTNGVKAGGPAVLEIVGQGGAIPPGSASVLAAGDVRYLPAPVVTMPNVKRMPQPPNPQIPQAPQPNQHVLANAFATPPAAAPAGGDSNQMANAFTPAAAPDESALGGPTAFPGAMAAHMGPMGPMMNPEAMMARGMNPSGPVNPRAMSGMAAGQTGPMSQGVQPAGYQAARGGAAPKGSAPGPDVEKSLITLRDSIYPSWREWAVDQLASCKAQTHPQVVDALVKALKDDPAAGVRVACARGLVRMGAASDAVVAALRALKNDADVRVRHAAEQALVTLAPGQPASGIQPASAVMPAPK